MTMMILKKRCWNCVLAVTAIFYANLSMADVYPSKPVKLIVPFAAGSASDTVTRSVAERLTSSMGQPFLVENRAGGGGTIANDYVAKAAPDGYTLLISTAALVFMA